MGCTASTFEAKPKHQIDTRDTHTVKYYACQGYGKDDGYRGWICSHIPLEFKEAEEWIRLAKQSEAPLDSSKRVWESPYMYMMIATHSRTVVERTLGQTPVYLVGTVF